MYGTITKDYILSHVSQDQIMEKYLGLKAKLGVKVCSPLRKDKNPTCEFRVKGDRLYFVDFSGDFFGDCFNVVERMYGVKFTKALEIVASDFNLGKKINVEKKNIQTIVTAENQKNYSSIKIKVRNWSEKDLQYWNQFGINEPTLKFFNVFACELIFLNDRIVYNFNANDPAYAYRFAKGEYKIYFPKRSHNEMRFMCNTTKIQGLKQLPEKGDLLIITKSYKDVMVLRRFGIHAISYQGEGILPHAKDVEILRKRFKTIFSFYDFDLAGIRTANRMRKLYQIPPVFLTNGRFGSINYGAKDPAEYVHHHGIEQSIKLLKIWKTYLSSRSQTL